jgi:hypothetical protein
MVGNMLEQEAGKHHVEHPMEQHSPKPYQWHAQLGVGVGELHVVVERPKELCPSCVGGVLEQGGDEVNFIVVVEHPKDQRLPEPCQRHARTGGGQGHHCRCHDRAVSTRAVLAACLSRGW